MTPDPMTAPARALVLLLALGTAAVTSGEVHAQGKTRWGSVDYRLAEEGAAAAARVALLVGTEARYQRFKDGELVTDDERIAVFEDTLDDTEAYRVEVTRFSEETGSLETLTAFLDRGNLRPLLTRRRAAGSRDWVEVAYGRDGATVSRNGTASSAHDTNPYTVEYATVQLLLLKFLDDMDRIRFSFLYEDGTLYHFSAHLRDVETVVLESGTYETLHVVCAMRGTWAHFAPKLHYWIEARPPYRLVRFQVKREVLELVE